MASAKSAAGKMENMNIEHGDTVIEVDDRDPNRVNPHLQVGFDEVIAEPDGVHSLACVWLCSQCCFKFWKGLCYSIMACLCGIPLATCWGCEFACISFCHIWHVTPCFRVLDINIGCLQRLWGLCVHCFCDPVCDAYSRLFEPFRRN